MNGSKNLYQAVQTWSDQQPEHTSIIETNTEKSISYYQLFKGINNVRKFLGSSPLSIVIALHGGIGNSVLWLTALTAGHLLIPISPQLTEFEFEEVIKKHKPDLLITETYTAIKEHTIKQLTLSQIETLITEQSDDKTPSANSDGSIYLETSGTTGAPKGMILTASQLMITANLIREQHQLTPQSRGLTPLPFYHVNAPVVSLLSSILAGSTVIIAPKFSAHLFWEWVQAFDPTWISIVPTIVAILLKYDKPEFLKNASLQFVRTASAPLPRTNLLAFEKKFGIPVIETYGVSEAGSTIFTNPLPPQKHKPGSVGLPLGIQVKLVDSLNKEVRPEEIGEVLIKGTHVISHYEKGQGEDSFDNGWFRTGDLGYMDNDGYLFLTSRKKEIIIRGGENIFPREIEEALLLYPHTTEVAVVGKKDDILGEKVVAFVVNSETDKQTSNEDMKQFAAAKLSPQKVPSEIYFIDQLPRGRTGKIDKNALKKDTIKN